MTFVPLPYDEIVETLLTALTSGVVREENTYEKDTKEYYFNNSPVIPESIRVVGIKDKQYHLFQAGNDYDADSEKITWYNNDQPDEGTKFYVNYYELNLEPVLTDRNVGSVTRTLAEAFSREIATLYQQLLLVYNSGFVDTANGAALDQVVAILGEKYRRKTGDYAVGDVLFIRDTPATADIFINDGFQVATAGEEPIVYETILEKTIRKGQMSTHVPVRATVQGQDGVTGANTITVMVQPITGIDRVTNPREISPIGRDETDEELRERVKHALETAGKTTYNALKYSLKGIPEVSDVSIVEDFTHGAGLVKVTIDTKNEFGLNEKTQKKMVSAELLDMVNKTILETKGAGIKVVHNLGPMEPYPEEPISEANENEVTESEVLKNIATEKAPDVQKKPITVHMEIELVNPLAPSEKKSEIEKEINTKIEAYSNKLKMGVSFRIDDLLSDIEGINGIKKITIIEPQESEINVEPNEKIIIENIEIVFLQSPVHVDVKTRVTITEEEMQESIIENEIKDKINAFIHSLDIKISHQEFFNSIQGSDYSITSLLYDIEYPDSGLIKHDINEGEEEIQTNEKFALRDVIIIFNE